MNVANKVLVLPNICGIELDASADLLPVQHGGLQPFYNTFVQNSNAEAVYTTPSAARFTESGKTTRAGMVYEQSLRISFPGNDALRGKRLEPFLQAKYIYIKLSGGRIFFFGRNDYFQNTALKMDISMNEKTTQITYKAQSIFPAGFTNGSYDFQLSEGFPVNFYNLGL